MTEVVVEQAARALRDAPLEEAVQRAKGHTDREIAWLRTRILETAAQALTVPS